MDHTVEGHKAFAPEQTVLYVQEDSPSRLVARSEAGQRFVRGTHEITWVRGSESRIRFSHGGRTLSARETCNDFYGFLTSFREHVDGFDALLESWRVDGSSTLLVEVEAWLEDTPTLGYAGKGTFGRDEYHSIPSGTVAFAAPLLEAAAYPRREFFAELDRVGGARRLGSVSHSRHVIWSSALERAKNMDAVEAFRALASDPSRIVGSPLDG